MVYKKRSSKNVCSVAQSCPVVCNPMDCRPPGSSVHGDSPGKNNGVGCHALLQGIFLTQGLNPGFQYCEWILYHLSHQGSPYMIMVLIVFSKRIFCTHSMPDIIGILPNIWDRESFTPITVAFGENGNAKRSRVWVSIRFTKKKSEELARQKM